LHLSRRTGAIGTAERQEMGVLTIYSSNAAPVVWKPGAPEPPQIIWLELHNPTDEERKFAASQLELPIPTRDQISGIELSSRIRADDKSLQLNIPSFVRDDGGQGAPTPLGFVLTPTILVSQRYADSQSFDLVAARATHGPRPTTSADALLELLDTFVDVAADHMERDSASLSQLSRAVFSEKPDHSGKLNGALLQIGRMQRSITQTRAAVLGLSRIVAFMHDVDSRCLDKTHHGRLHEIQKDLHSLADFDQQFSDKVQFLLDAVLGFINNEQNDVMKVLTITSVVTIPPMILAGIWGMNFKTIPEYDWPHGYMFAWGMIILSMIVPLIWFRIKKWI
jgi:magnesium transporter